SLRSPGVRAAGAPPAPARRVERYRAVPIECGTIRYQMQARSLPDVSELAEAASDDAARSDPQHAHRLRLVGAMAAVLAEKAYSTVTIADVARQARVSKRTFYEHFADKEACFIAVYATLSDIVLKATFDATAGNLPWATKLRASTRGAKNPPSGAEAVRRSAPAARRPEPPGRSQEDPPLAGHGDRGHRGNQRARPRGRRRRSRGSIDRARDHGRRSPPGR